MSETTSKRRRPDLEMWAAYSVLLAWASGPFLSARMTSEKPMMELSGVRSSWLTVARNADLVWLARSDSARAAVIAASLRLRIISSPSESEYLDRSESRSAIFR